jgi:hypothetical protein
VFIKTVGGVERSYGVASSCFLKYLLIYDFMIWPLHWNFAFGFISDCFYYPFSYLARSRKAFLVHQGASANVVVDFFLFFESNQNT